MSGAVKKSVVFIEPSGAVANVFEDYMKLPLTGTLYLGTILHNAGYSVRIFNESVLPERIDPFSIHADVYCISSLTTSATRAKTLANQFPKAVSSSAASMLRFYRRISKTRLTASFRARRKKTSSVLLKGSMRKRSCRARRSTMSSSCRLSTTA